MLPDKFGTGTGSMILHRPAQAIREQNWFSVVLEMAIVVIGILIGAWRMLLPYLVLEQPIRLERIDIDVTRPPSEYMSLVPQEGLSAVRSSCSALRC